MLIWTITDNAAPAKQGFPLKPGLARPTDHRSSTVNPISPLAPRPPRPVIKVQGGEREGGERGGTGRPESRERGGTDAAGIKKTKWDRGTGLVQVDEAN